MEKLFVIVICFAMILSLLCACGKPTEKPETESIPSKTESIPPETVPVEEIPVHTYEQGLFTERGYTSQWLNLEFKIPSHMVALDIEVNNYYNEAQKEANPDSYVTNEFATLDPIDSSRSPVRLTTEKLPDDQKTVQQLADEAKQAIDRAFEDLSAYNMTAELQWDPLRQMLFLGETYLMHHYRVITYFNGSVKNDSEYWCLYRIKEDRLITFSFGDEYRASRLEDFLILFTALEGNPPTVYVEDCVTRYDYEYDAEFHQPAIVTIPGGLVDYTFYDDLDPYSGYNGTIYDVTYDWSVVNGMVSICVYTNPEYYYNFPHYLVYNFSIGGNAAMLSNEEFIENMGLDWEEYRQQLADALERTFNELYGDFEKDSYFEDRLAFTLSETNLDTAIPFYTAADGLCVAIPVGSLAGSDYYERVVPLSEKEVTPMEEPQENADTGSQEEAIQIFWTVSSSNWNGYNMASLTESVFEHYDIHCTPYQGSGTQYLVTLSGEYCPNVVDLPYITETGSLTILVDTSTGEVVLMEDSGIVEAFEVFIALGTNWYSGG